ncbi:MAG: alpha/beta fold hydrolase, partial [Acidimicrobiales bacterium]
MLPVPFVDELVIDVDGFPITALVSSARPGAAPVVVAAHGITASSVSFARVAAVLGDEVTLAALDLRGRGASGTHPG